MFYPIAAGDMEHPLQKFLNNRYLYISLFHLANLVLFVFYLDLLSPMHILQGYIRQPFLEFLFYFLYEYPQDMVVILGCWGLMKYVDIDFLHKILPNTRIE